MLHIPIEIFFFYDWNLQGLGIKHWGPLHAAGIRIEREYQNEQRRAPVAVTGYDQGLPGHASHV